MSSPQQTVASYLDQTIEAAAITEAELSQRLGFTNPATVTSLRRGTMKVPINKVRMLAAALNVAPSVLLEKVMTEYMPDTWAEICAINGANQNSFATHDNR